MNLIDTCIDRKVKGVVALSTDKASSPVIIWSHQVSIRQAVSGNNYAGQKGTRFSIVRYGNVWVPEVR